MGRSIGIDLGTWNSAAAFALGRRRMAMIESRHGRTHSGKSFPSFVLFDRSGRKQVVGQRAREEMGLNPDLVVWGVKRLVGLSYSAARDAGELDRFGYAIEEGPGGSILIRVGEERYTPSHILEIILREIREDAENPGLNPLLGGSVDSAVISIPAYFKAIRTAPIVEAAHRAGFREVDTIAEPTAAAVHSCLDMDREAIVLAFDMGAGTLDVTVMMVVREGGDLLPGELCTSGHEALGGMDMDDVLAEAVLAEAGASVDRNDARAMAIVKEEIERAKIRLSRRPSTEVDLPGGRSIPLARPRLEEILAPLLDRCRGPIRVAMGQSGLEAGDVDDVLFIGGPTHMPCVRRAVRDELARLGARAAVLERIDAIDTKGMPVDPMESVARGAALEAGGVMEPVGKVVAEGYGMVFGPVEGAADFYSPIIREGSGYPVSGRGVFRYGNPKALEVPVPLVAKRPDTDRSTADEIVYRYEYLGFYTLGIKPTGDLPVLDIHLQVTDDKRVVATLTDRGTHQSVRFEGLDCLTGEAAVLQERTPPSTWTEGDVARFRDAVTSRAGCWTRSHLEHHVHVAQEALALAASGIQGTAATPARVEKAAEAVRAAVRSAVESDLGRPDDDCPNLSNRIKELLDALRQPGVDRITGAEFRGYLDQLTRIAEA